jgi:hypothetical protein
MMRYCGALVLPVMRGAFPASWRGGGDPAREPRLRRAAAGELSEAEHEQAGRVLGRATAEEGA